MTEGNTKVVIPLSVYKEYLRQKRLFMLLYEEGLQDWEGYEYSIEQLRTQVWPKDEEHIKEIIYEEI